MAVVLVLVVLVEFVRILELVVVAGDAPDALLFALRGVALIVAIAPLLGLVVSHATSCVR